MEHERQRPPRPSGRREVLRTSVEIGAFAVFAIVVLAVLAVVLHAGKGKSAPPPRTARRHADAGLRDARSRACAGTGVVGARIRDVREAPRLPGPRRVPRHEARSRDRDVPAGRVARPADVHVRPTPWLALQRRLARHRGVVRACIRAGPVTRAGLSCRRVPPRGRGLDGAGEDVDDSAARARARLRPAACPAVLLRRPGVGAERADGRPAVRRPVCDRQLHARPFARPRAQPLLPRAAGSSRRLDPLSLRCVPVADPAAARAWGGGLRRRAARVVRVAGHELSRRPEPPVRRAAADGRVPRAEHAAAALQAQPGAPPRGELSRSTARSSRGCSEPTAPGRATSTCRPASPGTSRSTSTRSAAPILRTPAALRTATSAAGRRVFLACGSEACEERALVVADALRKIGLHVTVDTSPGHGQLTLAGVRGTNFDIADVITRPDYGDPYALVDKLLDSRVIRAVGNTNISYFDDPAVRPRDRRGAAPDGRRPRPRIRQARPRGRAHGSAARRVRRAERARVRLGAGRLHHLPAGVRARPRRPVPRLTQGARDGPEAFGTLLRVHGAHSSSGLGHRPLTAAARVRIPYGPSYVSLTHGFGFPPWVRHVTAGCALAGLAAASRSPRIRVNVGKRSVGISAGKRGAGASLSTRGRSASVSAPGTGVGYRWWRRWSR